MSARSGISPDSPGGKSDDLRSIGFSIAEAALFAPPVLTREFYFRRIAIALLLTGGKDPKHKPKRVSVPQTDGTTATAERPCWCRICRAWVCLRNTPADELKEAQAVADGMKGPDWPEGLGCIDDRSFL